MRRWIVGAAIVALAATLIPSAVWVYRQDREVAKRFDGPGWALPSKVYSDSMFLRLDQVVRAATLTDKLRRLDYLTVSGPPLEPGQYRFNAKDLDLYLRPISIPDLQRPARKVQVRLIQDRVDAILDLETGTPLAQVEIEPELLAGFFQNAWAERRLLRLSEIPPFLIQAILAAEDRRFNEHLGLDLRGIVRAARTNLREGRVVEGGSTVTQQLARNFFLTQDRTWLRKFQEAVLAVLIERRYSKDRILEAYCNEIYMGQHGPVGIYGLGEAAHFYFRKEVGRLNQAEMALLAGLIRAPNHLSPRDHPERALARRKQVLEGMVHESKLNSVRAKDLASTPLGVRPPPPLAGKAAPYYADMVLSQLSKNFPPGALATQGLRIYTKLDVDLQRLAEATLEKGLRRIEEQHPRLKRPTRLGPLQGAMVVMDPRSGAIKALVGGRSYADSQFNRITQARRQPGSLFKPVVYITALESAGMPGGVTPATLIEDAPTPVSYQEEGTTRLWDPQNDSRQYRGPVTVRTALERSLNTPVVKVAQEIGLSSVIATARRLGLTTPMQPLPSLALGAFEVSPLEMAFAYAAIANNGLRWNPGGVQAVTGGDGAVLFLATDPGDQVMAPPVAYLMTHLLEGVIDRGTARGVRDLGFSGAAAGKTGTTDEGRDAWFTGYTPDLLALVWVGNDDNAPLGLSGASAALPIWTEFMRRAESAGGGRGHEAGFVPPPGVTFQKIDPETGLLVNFACPGGFTEAFIEGTAPTRHCSEQKGFLLRWLGRLLPF